MNNIMNDIMNDITIIITISLTKVCSSSPLLAAFTPQVFCSFGRDARFDTLDLDGCARTVAILHQAVYRLEQDRLGLLPWQDPKAEQAAALSRNEYLAGVVRILFEISITWSYRVSDAQRAKVGGTQPPRVCACMKMEGLA